MMAEINNRFSVLSATSEDDQTDDDSIVRQAVKPPATSKIDHVDSLSKVSKPVEEKKIDRKPQVVLSYAKHQISSDQRTVKRKRMLCRNMLKNNKCKYNDTCEFAHSILDQKIDPDKKEGLDILFD